MSKPSKTKVKKILEALNRLKYRPAETGVYDTMKYIDMELSKHYEEQVRQAINDFFLENKHQHVWKDTLMKSIMNKIEN